jgi:tRNA-dihydrouridine synthase
MGCPDKNVSKRGAGAGMIRQPQHGQNIICETKKAIADWAEGRKIEDVGLPNKIVRYVKDYVKARGITVKRRKIPVSVKTRIGVDKIVTEDWIKTLLEVEPANISLHGRTLKQLYSGQADWEEIGKAAALVRQTNTSILGNGDITSLSDAHEKINTYNLDGVLIGRATYGNPWIFAGREATPIERLNIAIEHVQAFYDLTPELNFLSMRKHLAWYCKGIVNAGETRAKLMQVTNVDEVREILQPYIDNPQMIAPQFQQ